ncbi:MAG TPA: M56 family metallopeptidase [Myxococcota bacterium]|nr:M56 family metallopeptidase [Myxococcota bacterium]
MSAELGTLALSLLALLGFGVLTSLGSALAWPALERSLRGSHPAQRARWLFAFATAATWLPLLLLCLCLAPGFLALIGVSQDHCLRQSDRAHLCFAHPRLALSLPLGIVLSAAIAVLVAGGVRGARRLARWHDELSGLGLAGGVSLASGARRIDSPRPFSVTLGLWRPEIWVSSALVEALPSAQLEIVVEHERAHVRRRDSLRRLVAAVLSRPHLPIVRRRVLAELALACEEACDESAARLGDRLAVAETVLAVERLIAQATPHPSLVGFGDGGVAERVRSLLEPAPAEPASALHWWLGSALAIGAMWLAHPLHHLTERWLGWLLSVL